MAQYANWAKPVCHCSHDDQTCEETKKCDPFEFILSVGNFKKKNTADKNKQIKLMFYHNLGDGKVYMESPAVVEEALKIAGWDINDGFTVDDIFMDNKIKFDQHKKWNLYGYGATRYYVGLDVGTDVTKKDFFTDYTKKPSTVRN